MASPIARSLGRASGHVPGLRRIPVLKLLALAEIALLLRDHVGKLDRSERQRLVALVRKGRGRPSNLLPWEREELGRLVAKAEPGLLFGQAADKLAPFPLPKRMRFGDRSGRG